MERLTPRKIERMSNAEIRKAYSHARSIANKRIARLTAAGLNTGKEPFPTLKEIGKKKNPSSHIASLLARASKFVSTKQTTVRVTRKRVQMNKEKLHQMGYDFIQSDQDVINFWKYMNDLREEYGDQKFSSDDALDVLQQGERLNIPVHKLVRDFEKWRDNIDKMEKLKPPRNGKEFSQQRIRRTLDRWEDEK